ncbi:MAG: hypothetical protein Q4E33_01000 [Erysipelotrichaceae bacterium]|nr:hypothetical protein [Erysipelotrichaceae bacterium]
MLKNKKIVIPVFIIIFSLIIIGSFLTSNTDYYVYEIGNSYGFSENNVNTISNHKNIHTAYGFFKKAINYSDEIRSFENSYINITAGRKPEKIKEIVLSNKYVEKNNYELGESFLIDTDEYKIVGLYDDMLTNKAVGYILSSNFDSLGYDSVYVYAKQQSDIKSLLADIENKLKDDRKQEITDFKNEQINQLKDKADVIKDSIQTLEDDAGKQLKDAEKEINDAKKQIDKYKNELDEANTKLKDSKNTLDEAKEELDSANKKLKNAKDEIDSNKKQFQSKLNEYGISENELESYKSSLENSISQSGYSRDFIKSHIDTINKLPNYTSDLIDLIDKALSQEEIDDDLWDDIENAYKKIDDFLPGISFSRNKESLLYLRTAVVSLQSNTNNIQSLVTVELTIEDLESAIYVRDQIKSAEKEYDSKYNEYLKGKDEYEDGLQEYDKKLKEYNDATIEFNSKKKEYDSGVTKYNQEKSKYDEQMNDFNNQLDDIDKDINVLKKDISNININYVYSDCCGSNKSYSPYGAIIGVVILAALFGYIVYRGKKNGKTEDAS